MVRTNLSESLSIRAHISQYHQYMFLTLVGQELCCGQRKPGSDDTLYTVRGTEEGDKRSEDNKA